MLELRSFSQVLKSLIESTTNRTDRITDFNVGSAIRTLYESIALQFEEFYFAMKQNIFWAIENSVYETFEFSRRNAVKAYGDLTIYFDAPLAHDTIIKKGETFSTTALFGDMSFSVMTDIVIPKGYATYLVPVQCTVAGIVGNVPQGTITQLTSCNQAIKRCYNFKAFTSGKDYETQAERKSRFKQYIASLGKGIASAVEYGILEIPEVQGCTIDDNYIGYVIAYVHDSDGLLSDSLKEKIQNNLINYRSAGIEVQLYPVRIIKKDVTLEVIIDDSYDTVTYANTIKGLITDYLNSFTAGTGLYMADLIHNIMTSYEEEIINVKVVNGSDYNCDIMEIIRPNNISVKCIHKKDWVMPS